MKKMLILLLLLFTSFVHAEDSPEDVIGGVHKLLPLKVDSTDNKVEKTYLQKDENTIYFRWTPKTTKNRSIIVGMKVPGVEFEIVDTDTPKVRFGWTDNSCNYTLTRIFNTTEPHAYRCIITCKENVIFDMFRTKNKQAPIIIKQSTY